MRPRHALRGLWLLLTLPVVFALVAGLGLIGQEVTAPSWLTARVEAQAARVLDGGALDFGEITVTIGPDLHPVVRLRGSVLRDGAGEVLARVPLIEASLSPRGLILRREVLPQVIRMTGAEIALRRAADGSVAVALGGAAPRGQAAGLAPALDMFDRVFEVPALSALETVEVAGLVVRYDDARAGRSWTVDGGRVTLDLTGGVTRASADLGLLSGRDFVTTLTFDYASRRGSRAATFSLSVTDAAAADIATQSPALAWLSVLDAPISAAIRSGLDEGGRLTEFRAELDIGAGALAPEPGAAPVRFAAARAVMVYDPAGQTIRFDRVAVESDWGRVEAAGQALLRDPEGGFPRAVVGQFTLSGAQINPAGLLPAPVTLPQTSVDLRLGLDPFALDFGQIAVAPAADGRMGAILASARVTASAEGWSVAADAHLDRIDALRLRDLWPEGVEGNTRNWYLHNVHAGEITDLEIGLRLAPGARPFVAYSHLFRDAEVTLVKDQPPVTGAAGHAALAAPHFSATLTEGIVTPPLGGAVDMAGTTFTIPDLGQRPTTGVVGLATESTITAALSLLDNPPMRFLQQARLPVELAEGRVRATGEIRFPMIGPLPPERIVYDIAGRLSGVESDVAVPGRRLTAATLDLQAEPGRIEIGGAAQVGAVPVSGTFTAGTGPDPVAPRIEGRVELSQRFLDEFGIALPRDMLSGSGEGRFTLDLPRGAAPQFALTSDLAGVGLALPALGWRKPAGGAGAFEVEGRLGPVPGIDRLAINAAGLNASGAITLTASGGLELARFDRVRLGDWLDAPVRLVGRGAERMPGIEIRGGALDLRFATFGAGGADPGGGPVSIALDRLQVTEGIALTGFRGDFQTAGGFAGQFTAAINGDAPVAGTVAPVEGLTAVRLQSDAAGAVLRAAGFLPNAEGGVMDLTLIPTGAEGTYDGHLSIAALRVREAPALASLLNAISVVGLLQQMAGQGLVFDEVLADFRIAPDRITVLSSSAVGPGLGISLDGIYTTADNRMDFQGVISPLYLINAVGSILTRRGEGLIGFNFTLRGPLGQAQVGVNPLSALTPGMFREIFRRPPPVVE